MGPASDPASSTFTVEEAGGPSFLRSDPLPRDSSRGAPAVLSSAGSIKTDNGAPVAANVLTTERPSGQGPAHRSSGHLPQGGFRIQFQAFHGHTQWILSTGVLCQQGFRFVLTDGPRGGPVLVTPQHVGFPLLVGPTGLPDLRCRSPCRGQLVYGEGAPGAQSIDVGLLVDSGAEVCCAGTVFADIRVLEPGAGRGAFGAEKSPLIPCGVTRAMSV